MVTETPLFTTIPPATKTVAKPAATTPAVLPTATSTKDAVIGSNVGGGKVGTGDGDVADPIASTDNALDNSDNREVEADVGTEVDEESQSSGSIAGIIVGVLILGVLGGAGVVYVLRQRATGDPLFRDPVPAVLQKYYKAANGSATLVPPRHGQQELPGPSQRRSQLNVATSNGPSASNSLLYRPVYGNPGTAVQEAARAMHDYDPKGEDELQLRVGDLVMVTKKDPSGWWQGSIMGGKQGLFPANYVEMTSNAQPTNTYVETTDGMATYAVIPDSIVDADYYESSYMDKGSLIGGAPRVAASTRGSARGNGNGAIYLLGNGSNGAMQKGRPPLAYPSIQQEAGTYGVGTPQPNSQIYATYAALPTRVASVV